MIRSYASTFAIIVLFLELHIPAVATAEYNVGSIAITRGGVLRRKALKRRPPPPRIGLSEGQSRLRICFSSTR